MVSPIRLPESKSRPSVGNAGNHVESDCTTQGRKADPVPSLFCSSAIAVQTLGPGTGKGRSAAVYLILSPEQVGWKEM